jgi:hypothetical protein
MFIYFCCFLITVNSCLCLLSAHLSRQPPRTQGMFGWQVFALIRKKEKEVNFWKPRLVMSPFWSIQPTRSQCGPFFPTSLLIPVIVRGRWSSTQCGLLQIWIWFPLGEILSSCSSTLAFRSLKYRTFMWNYPQRSLHLVAVVGLVRLCDPESNAGRSFNY